LSNDGADFGFVGGAYEAPDLVQNAQRLINWYVEVGGEEPKEPLALLGCPGLNPILGTQAGPVRGFWVLPGNATALVVTSNTVYLMSVTVPATQNAIAQFAIASVGTLLTNSGYVCIRDNGVLFGGLGGYAVLVDGTYGYLYRIAGAGTVTMQGSVTNGSFTLTPTGNLNYAFIVGATLSDAAVAIPPGTTVASISFNSVTITMSAAATASPGAETITATLPAFQQIMDPAFLGADRVAFIEGWLIFNQPGTRTFYTTAPVPYTVDFAGSFYALKDSSTDNLVTLMENNRELWLVGERTTEVWFNSGGANFAFSRIPGVGPQIGCSAKHSIVRLGTALGWLARNEQGENMVVVTDQYSWRRVSHHGVDHAIASYPLVSDAIAYAYQEEGHLFFMLTFPTADVTWCFDANSERWHQRLSYDPNAGVFHRHRSNCFADFADVRLVGDYTTGQIHQMSRSFYTDAGNPLLCVRRCSHIWSRQNRERIFYSSLQIEFTPGVGLNTGQGSNPQAMLRWQDEYGQWSNQHLATIGAIGATRNRAIWRRLAEARDRIYECTFSDPVQRDIVGATLFAQPEASGEEAA